MFLYVITYSLQRIKPETRKVVKKQLEENKFNYFLLKEMSNFICHSSRNKIK